MPNDPHATAIKSICSTARRKRSVQSAALLLVALLPTHLPAAEPPMVTEMDRSAAVLSSDATFAQKLLACKRLGQIGTERVVPVVAPLLTDEKLSHGARIALETIPGPASAAALRDAVPKLKGDLLVGVINSIGARRDTEAVAILSQKLHGSDAQIAAAAAAALGKIGNPQAAEVLLAQSKRSWSKPARRWQTLACTVPKFGSRRTATPLQPRFTPASCMPEYLNMRTWQRYVV